MKVQDYLYSQKPGHTINDLTVDGLDKEYKVTPVDHRRCRRLGACFAFVESCTSSGRPASWTRLRAVPLLPPQPSHMFLRVHSLAYGNRTITTYETTSPGCARREIKRMCSLIDPREPIYLDVELDQKVVNSV